MLFTHFFYGQSSRSEKSTSYKCETKIRCGTNEFHYIQYYNVKVNKHHKMIIRVMGTSTYVFCVFVTVWKTNYL